MYLGIKVQAREGVVSEVFTLVLKQIEGNGLQVYYAVLHFV